METTFFGTVSVDRRRWLLSDLRVRVAIAFAARDVPAEVQARTHIRELEMLPAHAPIALSREEAEIAYPEVVARHFGVAA